jgi:hypothetical protein
MYSYQAIDYRLEFKGVAELAVRLRHILSGVGSIEARRK